MKTLKIALLIFSINSIFFSCNQNSNESQKIEAIRTESDIDAEVNRLNGIKNWENVVERELMVSTEGGTWTLYFEKSSVLRMAKAIVYGETGQSEEIFYLDNNQQIFHYSSKISHYNFPLNYSAVMQDIGEDVGDVEIKIADSLMTSISFIDKKLINYSISDGSYYSQEEQSKLASKIQEDFEHYMKEAQ